MQVKFSLKFLKVILFQSEYFPYKLEDISIPAITLTIIKYQLSTRQTFFGRNKKATEKPYKSRKRKIKVIPLPPHPLKNIVAVGNYRLAENINKSQLQTNENITYTYKIFGEGNINAIGAPELTSNDGLSIFPPNTSQSIEREFGIIKGAKSFSYNIIPQEPGGYNLNKLLSWIYFNPKKGKYDTLKPSASFLALGESRKNANIASNNFGDFYDNIEFYSNESHTFGESDNLQLIINLIVGVSLILMGAIIYRKKKKQDG